MHYNCTVYLRRLRHEIKQIKSNVFYYVFYFKITPHFPPTVYLLCPPQLCTNTVTTTVHSSHETKNYECSATCPSLYLHGYGGPTGCPWVELCTSWHGWRGGWHLPSYLLSSSPLPREGHPRLPWPNVGRMPFLPLPLSINCVGLISVSPILLLHSHILMCLISLKNLVKL